VVVGALAQRREDSIERAEYFARLAEQLLISAQFDASLDERFLRVERSGGDGYGGLPRLLHADVFREGAAPPELRHTVAHLKVVDHGAVGCIGDGLRDADAVTGCQMLKFGAGGDVGGQSGEPLEAEVTDHAHSLADVLTDADELRHGDAAFESWWWWGWSHGGDVGVFVGLELHGARFDYWAGLVRAGMPYLYVEELDGTGLRAGLELKPPEMWAGHECDVPFRQWSLGNEAHGVLLDDPMDAMVRPFGTVAPVTFDIEWFSDTSPRVVDGGYEQEGGIDARIELREGLLELNGLGYRLHRWGDTALSTLPGRTPPAAVASSALAPYRCREGGVIQVLTPQGFLTRTIDAPYGGRP